MKKCHIAFVTIADLPQGGGNTLRLKRLVETLCGLGHRVSIWNQHRLGVAPVELLAPRGEFGGAQFEYVLGRIQRGSGLGVAGDKLRAVRALAVRLRRESPDVVWFNNLSFYDTWPLTRLAQSLGLATVQAYEDERLEQTTQTPISLSRRLFGLNARLGDRVCPTMADAVVVISSTLKDKYARLGVAPGKLHTVPTIIDCDAWECGPEPDTDAPRLLYAGTFGEQDEIENFIRAMGRLRDQEMSFGGIMLGDNLRDPELSRRARGLVTELGLTDRVLFKGFVSAEEVKREICSANLLVGIRRDGPWARSGLPTKLSEYLASGRAVVASRVGETGRYLEDGLNALLVSAAADSEEIADALGRAISSVGLRSRLGQAGRRVALEHFDQRVVGQTLQDMLEAITA